MIVVIDTNTVLQALAARNILRPLMEAWFNGALVWAVSTEILLEYEEIITLCSGNARWRNLTAMLDVVEELRPANLKFVSPTYRFHLIVADPDDDKFADCAIAAEAEWIITEDTHFHAMKGSGHKPQPISPEDFIRRFLGGQ